MHKGPIWETFLWTVNKLFEVKTFSSLICSPFKLFVCVLKSEFVGVNWTLKYCLKKINVNCYDRDLTYEK